jgi:hypothetical protein
MIAALSSLPAIAAAEETKPSPAPAQPAKGAEPDGGAPEAQIPDQAALEKKFAEDLSGVVFAGSYSTLREGKESPAEMERYTITRVAKAKNDYWVFSTRIQYGKRDVTLPLTLQVKWAGDTPMITLTDLTIPGLGTFTSRVLIYGDRYAGTWQHGKTGGHLWGRIEKAEKPTPAGESSEKTERGPETK